MTPGWSVLAVGLAGVGAVFFGLASVRQHDVVRAGAARDRAGLRERAAAGFRLVREPRWLLGAVQAGLGGGLHVVALALAPITLVQPVGVLAVPVTVVVSALGRRRRPAPVQVLGTILSVVGVAALTVVLLIPPAQPAILPSWHALAAGTGGVLLVGSAIASLIGRPWAPALLRCVSRAVVAAAFFGLNSILIRALGEVVASSPTHPAGLVGTAVVGIALALPLGVWAMQSAYLFGSPQVVICCLTLVDPLTAVVGGRALLQDGAALSGPIVAAALGCGLLAAAGVVLLARDYPLDTAAGRLPPEPVTRSAANPLTLPGASGR